MSTDVGSSFDGSTESPRILREQRDGMGPTGVPKTIQEDAQHLQQQPSEAERRRSREVSRKARSTAVKASERSSRGDNKNNLWLEADDKSQSDLPSVAENDDFSKLLSFQRGAPKGRCSCMLKRHFDERSRLSKDLGQEAAFTESDHSFADLMKSAQCSSTSPSSLPRQLSDTTISQPSSELPSFAGDDYQELASASTQGTRSTAIMVSCKTVHCLGYK